MSVYLFKLMRRFSTIAPLLLVGVTTPAMAQQNTMATTLCNALKFVSGAESPLVAFVAGIAVIVFFVVLALNEGNQMVTWAIKILIGVAGLISVAALLSSIFKIQMLAC
jgi:type IV secretory pathway VirB2 component (pilin)